MGKATDNFILNKDAIFNDSFVNLIFIKSQMMSDRDMQQIANEKTEEAFQQSPYDPG